MYPRSEGCRGAAQRLRASESWEGREYRVLSSFGVHRPMVQVAQLIALAKHLRSGQPYVIPPYFAVACARDGAVGGSLGTPSPGALRVPRLTLRNVHAMSDVEQDCGSAVPRREVGHALADRIRVRA